MRYRPGLCGWLLIGTGLLHAVGFGLLPAEGRRFLAGIVRDGMVGAVAGPPERYAWFWFVMFGWLAVVLGQAVLAVERRTGAPPRSLGWQLLAMSVVGLAAFPVSGFWLVLGQAILALVVSRRSEPTAVSAGAGQSRIPPTEAPPPVGA